MAAALTSAKLLASFQASYTRPNAISTPSDSPTLSVTHNFVAGSSANAATKLSYGQLTIPINSIVTVDLSNQTDSMGATFSFVTENVKGLFIQNTTTTGGAWVKISPGATNGWVVAVSGASYGPFSSINQGLYLGAGGVFALDSPNDGYSVPDGSHCTIDILGNPTVQSVLSYAIWG